MAKQQLLKAQKTTSVSFERMNEIIIKKGLTPLRDLRLLKPASDCASPDYRK